MSENEYHVTVHVHIPVQRGGNHEVQMVMVATVWCSKLGKFKINQPHMEHSAHSGQMKAQKSKNHLKHMVFTDSSEPREVNIIIRCKPIHSTAVSTRC